MNRTSELGSSGKIIHQGDDLGELELGSDGLASAGNNSYRVSGFSEAFKVESSLIEVGARFELMDSKPAISCRVPIR